MKKTFTLFFIALFSSVLFAQTDVTSQLFDNPDFEDGTATGWTLGVSSGAVATFGAEADQGSSVSTAGFVNVTTSGNFSSVPFRSKNALVTNYDFADQKITVSCNAKSASGGSQFRIRLVVKFDDGTADSFNSSSVFNLTSAYQSFSYTLKIPANATQLQAQVLCGAAVDKYYFDDFTAAEEIVESQTDVTSDLISNPGFEDGTNGWNFFATAPAAAAFSVETGSAASGTNGAKLHVTAVQTTPAFNHVVLRSDGVTNSADWSGKTITLSAQARSSSSGTFKFRFVATPSNGGADIFWASASMVTTTAYQTFTTSYDVPDDISQVTLQVMAGSSVDTFEFDDFSATVNGTLPTLSIDDKDLTQDFTLYPNPASDVVNIKTNRQISNVDVYDLVGRKQAVVLSEGTINISSLNSGVYILSVKLENGASLHKKITKL